MGDKIRPLGEDFDPLARIAGLSRYNLGYAEQAKQNGLSADLIQATQRRIKEEIVQIKHEYQVGDKDFWQAVMKGMGKRA